MTGGPGKPLPTGRVQERSQGDAMPPSTSQNPSHWHLSWLSNACTTRKDPESEQLAKDNPETNPFTIKPEILNQGEEQFSWVSLPCCSLPGCPFPIKSLPLSACASPRTILLWVSDKSPLPGPGWVSRQEHWSGLPFPSPMHESGKWKWSCSVVSDS